LLTKLHIKNIAVIDEITIEFVSGFNVLTGETGAGKSIIIDSINMVLGQRTNKDLIRNGEERAAVEAIFEINSESVKQAICNMGIDVEDDLLLIYRDLNTDGKSNCRINGQLVTAGMIKEIAKLLINIHGQHDNQVLLTPSKHIELLDSFANAYEALSRYRAVFEQTKTIENALKSCTFDEQEKQRRIDLLQYQIEEISSANLKADEEDLLNERKIFLNSAGRITNVIEKSREILYNGSDEALSVHDLISGLVSDFSEISKYDEKLKEFYNQMDAISISIDDVIYQIRDYADTVEFDIGEINSIEERLDVIHKLKRKYGANISEIIEFYDKIAEELEQIASNDERIIKLNSDYEKSIAKQREIANEITQLRKKFALVLEEKIMQQLTDLDMNKVNFVVSITDADFNINGADAVEFLISTNMGEPVKPLSKIASGGEMSRIMLAIKSILADTDEVSTLIFDEIDTGVSGRAAQKIAEKIHKISAKKQILSITHLAQIASMAKTHFLIEKNIEDNKTKTKVIKLSQEERTNELARIIGGAQITPITLQNAKEMLERGQEH